MSEWKSIETAPRDGTQIIAYLGEYEDINVINLRWMEEDEDYYAGWYDEYRGHYKPLYWMPLPEIPKKINEGYYPPPWNIEENPEKTKGWIAFQELMRNDPDYYNKPNVPKKEHWCKEYRLTNGRTCCPYPPKEWFEKPPNCS